MFRKTQGLKLLSEINNYIQYKYPLLEQSIEKLPTTVQTVEPIEPIKTVETIETVEIAEQNRENINRLIECISCRQSVDFTNSDDTIINRENFYNDCNHLFDECVISDSESDVDSECDLI